MSKHVDAVTDLNFQIDILIVAYNTLPVTKAMNVLENHLPEIKECIKSVVDRLVAVLIAVCAVVIVAAGTEPLLVVEVGQAYVSNVSN